MRFKKFVPIAFLVSMALFSCEKNCSCPMNADSEEFTALYQCKNHCKGSGAESETACPCCGKMQNKASEFTHSCPNHKEMSGFINQSCKKCGTKLEPKSSIEN